jgi:excisionase family DNA binding protein
VTGISLQTLAIVEAWGRVARRIALADSRVNGRGIPDTWDRAINECRAASMIAGPSVNGRLSDKPPTVLRPSTPELPVDEVARRLNITTRTVRRRIAEGKLDGRKIGRQWLIRLNREGA